MNTDDDYITSTDSSYAYTDLGLIVLAEDNTEQINGAGCLALSQSVGAGVTIGTILLYRETEAIVGDYSSSLSTPGATEASGDGYAPGVGVDSGHTINVGFEHGFATGDAILYSSGGDTTIDGLRDSDVYYAEVLGDHTLRPARTVLEAEDDASTHFTPATAVSANVIDLGYTHGFRLGDLVEYDAGGDDPIDGLTDGDLYYVIPISDTSVALATAYVDAAESDFTYFHPAYQLSDSAIYVGDDHDFEKGDPVYYNAGGNPAITGLTDGAIYYVVPTDNDTLIRLATSPANADSETTITLSVPNPIGANHYLAPAFCDTGDNIDEDNRTITFEHDHGFSTGDAVRYVAEGDAIDGLTSGQRYYAIAVSDDELALAATEDEADNSRQRFFGASELSDEDGDDKVEVIDLLVEHSYSTGSAITYDA